MSGAWQTGLLAACGLAVVVLVVILVAAAAWHSKELEEVNHDLIRSQDVENRGVANYERAQREHVERVAGQYRDETGKKTDIDTMTERGRRQMAKARPAPVEVLVVSDEGPESPRPIAQAGRFDQTELSTPSRLLAWIGSLGDCVCESSVPVSGGRWRILGIRECEVDSLDRAEIERLGSWLMSLDMAHQLGAGSMEESA